MHTILRTMAATKLMSTHPRVDTWGSPSLRAYHKHQRISPPKEAQITALGVNPGTGKPLVMISFVGCALHTAPCVSGPYYRYVPSRYLWSVHWLSCIRQSWCAVHTLRLMPWFLPLYRSLSLVINIRPRCFSEEYYHGFERKMARGNDKGIDYGLLRIDYQVWNQNTPVAVDIDLLI